MTPDQGHPGLTPARQTLWLLVLVMLCMTTWAFQHGYLGIRHDGILYTLQGLARLHAPLANDVFLRFGSQDQFSLFGTIYAHVIQWMGLEPAAALLTFLSQLAVILGAALLLREVAVTPVFMGMGIVVLIAMNGSYGSREIFACIEGCVTPRMGAEALVLAGLAAALAAHKKLAWTAMVVGMLIHPVMATAGVVALVFFYYGRRWPRLTLGAIGGGLLLLWVAGYLLPQGPWGTYDSDWLAIVRERSPFVFLAGWRIDDWGRAAVPLATLAIGSVVLVEGRARTLSRIALCTALSGLTLTLVACDVSKVVIFTQLQPWRWQWLAVVVAGLLLPSVAFAGWKQSRVGKIAVALLIAAWLFESDATALLTSLLAVASLALTRFADSREVRTMLYGALVLALMALAYRIGTNLLFLNLKFMDWRIPLWIRELTCVAAGGVLPMAVILLATWLAERRYGAPALAALAAVMLTVCIGESPDAWRRWSSQRFPPALVAQFAPWKALLPANAEILWSEEPLSTWVFLDRPSYISVSQSAGVMFSRPSAMDLLHRAQVLDHVAPVTSYLDFDSALGAGVGPSPEKLDKVCAALPSGFVVAYAPLSWQPVAQLPKAAWHSLGALRLYRCADRVG